MTGYTATASRQRGQEGRLCWNCPDRRAKRHRSLCWQCLHPGKKPPPCRICGCDRYYCAGYCYSCHPRTRGPRSCLACLAWGEFPGYLCSGCAALRWKYGTARCPGCRRPDMPLDRGYCRLCRHQALLNARAVRPCATTTDADRQHAARSGLQLFFAEMQRSLHLKHRKKMRGTKAITPVVQPRFVVDLSKQDSPRQLRLVDPPRDVRRVRIADVTPCDPELSEAVRAYVEDLAVRRGWSMVALERTRAGLMLLVAVHGFDEPIRASTVRQLSERRLPVDPMLEILADLGLLQDDRPDRLALWIRSRLEGLPADIQNEIGVWVDHLRNGGPRSRPRSAATTRIYVNDLTSFFQALPAEYRTLRQVTTADIRTWLEAVPAQRYRRSCAVRSLFRTLKAQRLVFLDPAKNLPRVQRHLPTPLPLTEHVQARLASAVADDVELRLIVALAGVHALTRSEIRHLQLEDVDLANRRLEGPPDPWMRSPTMLWSTISAIGANGGPARPILTCSSRGGAATHSHPPAST
jgi:hypothetical protein